MSILCMKCGYSITEPICTHCIINEIKIWVYDKKVRGYNVKKINDNLKFLLGHINSIDYALLPSPDSENISIMECIKCKEKINNLCYYCIANQSSIVEDSLRSKKFIESFHESFNTEIYDRNHIFI